MGAGRASRHCVLYKKAEQGTILHSAALVDLYSALYSEGPAPAHPSLHAACAVSGRGLLGAICPIPSQTLVKAADLLQHRPMFGHEVMHAHVALYRHVARRTGAYTFHHFCVFHTRLEDPSACSYLYTHLQTSPSLLLLAPPVRRFQCRRSGQHSLVHRITYGM